MRKSIVAAAALAVVGAGQPALAQFRIVTMNSSNSAAGSAGPRSGMDTILSAIGSSLTDDPTTGGPLTGIARKIDILCLQEFNAPGTTGAQFAALMNSSYGTTSYSYGTLAGSTTGSA